MPLLLYLNGGKSHHLEDMVWQFHTEQLTISQITMLFGKGLNESLGIIKCVSVLEYLNDNDKYGH